jgi:sec-independent protein translocase protein TatB
VRTLGRVDGFFGINGWEFLVLILLAMFIFGPDRLPKAISDGVRMLRNLRDMARNATTDLGRELGTDLTLEDLNPKTLIRKHILSEEDERTLRAPFEDLYRDVERDIKGVKGDLSSATSNVRDIGREVNPRNAVRGAMTKPVTAGGPTAVEPPRAAYDEDAT